MLRHENSDGADPAGRAGALAGAGVLMLRKGRDKDPAANTWRARWRCAWACRWRCSC